MAESGKVLTNHRKYCINSDCIRFLDRKIFKVDPYGTHVEVRPHTASTRPRRVMFGKTRWMKRCVSLKFPYPLNIFEAHLELEEHTDLTAQEEDSASDDRECVGNGRTRGDYFLKFSTPMR